ncbi:MFS transporter [Actinoplanes aureus]|uniref:MFS transporter n=1 Tax=Actinoplanes aureus TaxID=2792083 RepID=A0A931FVF5_9ACTN|nr:MFS transporter [Actinoplanes aureus]MBG0560205.1 MFS transporter [Actinoplanes aureus]
MFRRAGRLTVVNQLSRLRAELRPPEDHRQRLLAMSTLVNTIGTGMFLSAGTIFLIRSVGLSPAAAGVGLTVGSLIGFGAGVLIGDQADRRGARQVMIAAMLLEAAASASLLLVHSLWPLLVVAALAAVGRAGTNSARGAVIGVLAEPGKGAVLRTYLRAVTNVGLAIGMLASAVVLAVDNRAAYVIMILTDTTTFLVAAAILARLPHLVPTRTAPESGRGSTSPRWLALRDGHYLALTAATSIASLQYWILLQALPLWIVLRTEAPRWMVALLLFLAAVTVALTQIPATRSINGPRPAARLLARSGPVFLVAWILMAAASGPSAGIAVALLLAGVLVHSLAEVWQVAGTFELSFALARPEAQGQYQGVIGLGQGFVEALAPVIVIALCINVGAFGWIALGLLVTAASFAGAIVERRWARSHARAGNEPIGDTVG